MKNQVPKNDKEVDDEEQKTNQNRLVDDQAVDLSPRSSIILMDPNNYEQKCPTSREQRMERERQTIWEEERIDRSCAVEVEEMEKPGAYRSEPNSYVVSESTNSLSDDNQEDEPAAAAATHNGGTTAAAPSITHYDVEAEVVEEIDLKEEDQAPLHEEDQLKTGTVKAQPVILLAVPSVGRRGFIGLALIIVLLVAIVLGIVFGRNDGDDGNNIPPSTSGTCGNGSVGNGICNDGLCCSKDGYCGCGEDYCISAGETCLLPEVSCPVARCGSSWENANGKCGMACSVNEHCGAEKCFDALSPSPCRGC
jgi:hypothetical protein